jgi:AcrR family transcriptional regulator
MPYPVGHRDKVRMKIVQAARRLFNRNGFENTSVNQIMAAAGLTRGGFYSYFESKSDLYVEVLSCFFTDPNWKKGRRDRAECCASRAADRARIFVPPAFRQR